MENKENKYLLPTSSQPPKRYSKRYLTNINRCR